MSGWNDPDKLAEARAAHASFTSRSPDPRGHGRGRGRGRGSASPSPARGSNNSGNNMNIAGRGRGGPPTPASGGPGGFGGNNTARVGGSGGCNRPAVPLATSEQFFALLDSKKANVPIGGSTAVSSIDGTSAAPSAQKTFAQDANNFSGGGPMELDQPAHSSNTTSNPSGVLTATQGNVVKGADTSGGRLDLDNIKHVQSKATPLKSESPKRGLMSSQWSTAAGASGTGGGTGAHHPTNATPPVTTSTNNYGTHMKTDERAGNPKNAQSKAGTNNGLGASRWAKSSPSPPTNPSELAPIYRSQNWIEDLREENEAEVKRRAAVGAHAQARTSNPAVQNVAPTTAPIGAPKNASNIPAQQAARPAPASGVSMQGQAYAQRPNAIQSGTQPAGQQSVNVNQLPVGAARPAVGRTQAYKTSPSQLPTQVQAQQAPGAAAFPAVRAHASPNTQPFSGSGGFDGLRSSAGFGAGPTAQSIQQPAQPVSSNVGQQLPQAARPAGGGSGQQHSQDPFNDPDFKDFWDNHYLPNNG